ncbi:MAG: IS5 family transposase [Spirochaetes bacterium]|jgi:hypothetical protein|nr:IS5 family transposase [Spirochaetota bacterium]
MYRQPERRQREFEDFYLPFGGSLDPHNRWVRLASIIPWEWIEERYARLFAETGAPGKRCRVAVGALIIKQKLGVSDEETVEQIRENPYLQFFIGLEGFSTNPPFEASAMVHFRKRLSGEVLGEINDMVIARERGEKREKSDETADSEDEEPHEPENQGRLLCDASCAPQDIRHPTDIGLLNDAREATEAAIDVLHARRPSGSKKPRTYRQNARRDYLRCAKNKRLTRTAFRRGRKKQLQYLRRNLRHIRQLSGEVGLSHLRRSLYRKVLVAGEVERQQREMHESDSRRTAGRIVSLSQPHVRPIVRGKAGTAVEFGSKISLSVADGFARLHRISWEAYNEGGDLPQQVESYRVLYGCYPESVHVDKIYRTRENRRYCKERGIRISGRPLGRPPMDTHIRKAVERQTREDERTRVAVEGKLGEGKRCYGLDRVVTKLKETSESTIAMAVLVMNLQKLLRDSFGFLLYLLALAAPHLSDGEDQREAPIPA